eukprot:PITA_31196
MPFGLMNVGATFQRAMDISFVGEKDKFFLIYLDDITVFSSSHEDHLQHLKKLWLKYKRFGSSINPKKSHFSLEEGKILGHIVSTEGVKIDPARVQAIQTLSIPRSTRDIQSFLGKINFVRRFIPKFVELVEHITSMLKKGSEIKWTDSARSSFEAMMEAPTLISLDYTKEFYILSFASYDTLAVVLSQKNDEGVEQSVAFFSKTLRDAKLRYALIEKQGYALIKSLKTFRIYILHSQLIAYVPLASVKDFLTQLVIDGKRAKWIIKFIEFNIKVKPTRLVKGQGLSKLMAEENYSLLDINCMGSNSGGEWTKEAAEEQEQNRSLAKSLATYEWFAGRQQLKSLPLKLVHANGPFQQWGLDFIGDINPHSSGHHKWILVATDYFTKWIEAIPTKNDNHKVIIKFLNENILTRFGCPTKLVTDNATTFQAKDLVDVCESMGIKLVHSTSYYPQGNGLTESSNKSLVRIIKKLLEDNKKNWDSKLKFALWADRVTNTKSIRNSPCKLVYSTDVVFPI